MRDASTYPITTVFGYIDGYPLNGGFHKGVDRACPTGTPLIVNGNLIAKTGNTGASTGSHLHLGRFVNGQPTNPSTNGFVLKDPTVIETGQDSTSGKFIKIRDLDGVVWFYCHLSEILTKAGKLEDVMTEDGVRYGYLSVTRKQPSADNLKYWIGRPSTEFTKALYKLSDEYYGACLARNKELEALLAQQATPLLKGIYEVK